tara:strand:- start:76 stop:291 length:216 start_codon:yes stop_codon:yes gene_type:complete
MSKCDLERLDECENEELKEMIEELKLKIKDLSRSIKSLKDINSKCKNEKESLEKEIEKEKEDELYAIYGGD